MANEVHHHQPPVPGTRFTLSRGPVTTTQLVKYAGVSGDFNRIHFDYPFAREAGLDGLLVHGMLTMGFVASALTAHATDGAWVARLASRFLSPVSVGDVVQLTAEVTAVEGSHADFLLEATVGDRVVLKGEAQVCYAPPASTGGVHGT